jgi:hypothetical protein
LVVQIQFGGIEEGGRRAGRLDELEQSERANRLVIVDTGRRRFSVVAGEDGVNLVSVLRSPLDGHAVRGGPVPAPTYLISSE